MERYQKLRHFISFVQNLICLFFLFGFVMSPQATFANDAESGFDLKIGERLFNGLIPIGENKTSCVSCHAFHSADTLNFNPTAFEISEKAKSMSEKDFANALLNGSGNVMSKLHAGYQLDSLQIGQLHLYLSSLNHFEHVGPKPVIDKLLSVILLSLLIVLALVDLIFIGFIKYKPVHILTILFAGAFILKILAHNAIDLGRSKNYEPDQPIKFSHKVHSGDMKIDCFYCHSNADEGKSAGIPNASVCMNCHSIVREGSRSGKSEINKLIAHVEKSQPIEWIRIHQLPDHVFFSHDQHVKAGKVSCQECHGKVEEMHRVKQVNDLSMGWCLDCHRTKKVDFKDNAYYQTFKDYHQKIKSGEMDSVVVADIGGNDCMKCHY